MEKLNYKILDSVTKIAEPEWNSVFGELLQGYAFYRAVEASNLEGFSFYYILIYEEAKLVLIAPVFISDFKLDIAVGGFAQSIIRFVRKAMPRFLILKTLFCGSPISENGIIGINEEAVDKKGLLRELSEIMLGFCKDMGAKLIMFKDFLKDDIPLLNASLTQKGYFLAESFPMVIADLNFDSIEAYFASLSHNVRKDLRRKLRKAQLSEAIVVKSAGNVEDIIEDVYRLYLNTYKAGAVRFEKLTREFFISAGRLIPQTKFFLYYVNGKLSAFNLCFAHKDTLIDEFIGFDYNTSYKYNLYFYSWCYNVEWCLKNSITYYQAGQTDYHPKLRLGGRLIPLYAFMKHNNLLLSSALRLLAKVLTPVNLDQDIKDYKTKNAQK